MANSPDYGVCPSRAILAAFLREELSLDSHLEIISHTSCCDACGSAIRELDAAEDEPFLKLCAGHTEGENQSISDDPCYQRMVAAAFQAFPAGPMEEEMPPPERLGQYQLFKRIGRGGMGVVYHAQHLRLKRSVAVKLLPQGRVADERAIARFEREMEIVGRLDHPNIVRAMDAGYADGLHYLAMELIDGLDLAQLIRRNGLVPVPEACELVRQTAVALQHAFEHGLVHRDIKPNNLMLSTKGEVKLLDLGLARLRCDQMANTLTARGQVMGTTDYMAPEQWESSHEVDIRSDIYSLGCTLFTLLTGAPPFAGPPYDTVYKKLKAHHEAPIPLLSAWRHDVPAELEEIFRQMMQKEPALRQQTPAEVAQKIAAFCTGNDLSRLLSTPVNEPSRLPELSPRTVDTKTHHESPTDRYPSTVSLTPASRKRKAALWVVLTAFVAFACIGIAFAFNWDRDRQTVQESVNLQPPTSRAEGTPTDPSIRSFQPGEWYDLLDREPRVIRWLKKDRNCRKVYDPKEMTLDVSSSDWGMLELGEVNGSGFELEATILQNPWLGGVGVFFRGREEEPMGSTKVVADFLALWRLDTKDTKEAGHLIFGEVHQFIAPPYQMLNSPLTPKGSVLRPSREPHRLNVSVGKEGLEKVMWDDMEVDKVCEAVAKGWRRKEPDGKVGVWIQEGQAFFLTVRIRLHSSSGVLK